MLDQAIRDVVDALADPLSVDEITNLGPCAAIDPTAAGRRGRGWIAACVIVLLAGLAGWGLIETSGSPRVATQPSTTVSDAAAGWVRLPDPYGAFQADDVVDSYQNESGTVTAPSSVFVSDFTRFGDEWLAVGTVSVGFRSEPAVWRSADAQSWRRMITPDLQTRPEPGAVNVYGASMSAAADQEGQVVVFGSAYTQTGDETLRAWVSTDTASWLDVDLDTVDVAPAATVIDVVDTRRGFVAVGINETAPGGDSGDGSFVLTSPDGITWERLPAPEIDAPGIFLSGMVVADDDRLIVYGSERGHRPVVWYSDNSGITWTPSTLPARANLPHTIDVAAAGDTGPVLFGHEEPESALITDFDSRTDVEIEGDINVLAWTSSDNGATFDEVDTTPLNSGGHDIPTAVIAHADGILATTRRTTTEIQTRVWRWTPTDGFAEQDHADLLDVTALTATDTGPLAATADHASSMAIGSGSQPDPISTQLWTLPN